jgi:hypothetical protein
LEIDFEGSVERKAERALLGFQPPGYLLPKVLEAVYTRMNIDENAAPKLQK